MQRRDVPAHGRMRHAPEPRLFDHRREFPRRREFADGFDEVLIGLRIARYHPPDRRDRAVAPLLVQPVEPRQVHGGKFEHQEPAGTYTPTATVIGGTIGAALGGLSVIAAAIATGGVALWAAGPITAWAGGVTGGLVGAMMTRGVEKELANFYQQAVLEGQILVAAEDHGPHRAASLARAAKILADAGAKPVTLPEG